MSYTVTLKREADKEFSLLPKNYYKLVKRHLLELKERAASSRFNKIKRF